MKNLDCILLGYEGEGSGGMNELMDEDGRQPVLIQSESKPWSPNSYTENSLTFPIGDTDSERRNSSGIQVTLLF
jgi:hypothetical protein